MDRNLASKIRALALAGRCLAREMKSLRESPPGIPREDATVVETERIVGLARVILDPAGSLPSTGVMPGPADILRAVDPDGGVTSTQPVRNLLSDTAPSQHHILALSGQGTVVPMPELIGFLGTVGKTGILRIKTQDAIFVLEFLLGDIVHGEANTVAEGQRLGDLLVAKGVIDRKTLEGAVGEESTWRIGQILLKKELIQKADLITALQTQIQTLFNRLFRDEAKSFTFWSGPPLCAEDGVRLNTTSLLLEGARSSDEAGDGVRAAVDVLGEGSA
jgi:hypothetical protein